MADFGTPSFENFITNKAYDATMLGAALAKQDYMDERYPIRTANEVFTEAIKELGPCTDEANHMRIGEYMHGYFSAMQTQFTSAIHLLLFLHKNNYLNVTEEELMDINNKYATWMARSGVF